MAEEDMIFGKNRHFFGGIEPGNMKKFEVRRGGRTYSVNCVLPEDTIINDTTVCTVAGAVIRYKYNKGFPKDEFDGELLADIKESGCRLLEIPDEHLGDDIYFAAFPYTTQGVYNRNESNRCALYVNFKSAIGEPWIDETVSIAHAISRLRENSDDPGVSYPYVELVWMGACDGESGDPCSNFMIRRSTSGYPVNETDGDKVFEGTILDDDGTSSMMPRYCDYDYTADDQYKQPTYYYTIFPYNEEAGVYAYIDTLKAKCTIGIIDTAPRDYTYLYGFDLDTTDPNPATRVTYPEDVDNYGYTPATMNYANDMFNYGDWPSQPGVHFMPTPVMLKTNGLGGQTLDHRDYGRKADGVDSSVSDIEYDGNAMMEWPKIYTKRTFENGIYKFRCSDKKIDDSWECWCNYDKSNNETNYFYTAIYPAANISNKFRSISRQTIYANSGLSTELTGSEANGAGWQMECLADRLLINDLLIMMAKTTDCQKAYGMGVCGESSAVTTTGTMDQKGLFWGSRDKNVGVKVFGMEHYWGNHLRRVSGLLVAANGNYKVKITRGTKDGTTAADYNVSGNGYFDLGPSFSCSYPASGDYIREMIVKPYGRIPIRGYGTSTTYEPDWVKVTKPNSDASSNHAMFGGSYSLNETQVGPFTINLTISNATGQTYATTSLAYKG